MNRKKKFKCIVPYPLRKELQFQLKNNTPNFSFHQEGFYWLINQIIYFSAYKGVDKLKEGGFVAISSKQMQAVLINYKDYLRYMEQLCLIECDNSYSEEKKEAMGYKIATAYLKGFDKELSQVYINPDTHIWKKIKEQSEKRNTHHKIEPFVKKLKKYFNSTDFDYKGARAYIESMEITNKNADLKRLCYMDMINRLEDKRLRNFAVSKSNGRLNSNYTNMLKELRQFIKGDKLVIDLSNSQPYFLSKLLYQLSTPYPFSYNNSHSKALEPYIFKGLQGVLKKTQFKIPYLEWMEFNEEVKSGLIYERLANELSSKWTRTKVKKNLLAMFYCKNSELWHYHELAKVFEGLFPSIFHMLIHLKSNNHSALAICMQLMESDIFIRRIAKRLTELEIECLTIHDSVVFNKTDYIKVKRIMNAVFSSFFNETPNLKTTDLKDKVQDITCYLFLEPLSFKRKNIPGPEGPFIETLYYRDKPFIYKRGGPRRPINGRIFVGKIAV